MDLTDLIARCQARFRDDSGAVYDTDDWTGYLNDAYSDVWTADPYWPFRDTVSCTCSVAAHARSGALPAGVTRVTAVRNATNNIVMRAFEGRREHIEQYPEQSDTGMPVQYRITNGRIEVYPLPDGIVTLHIEYLAPITLLDDGADVPVFPEQFHSVLVNGALAYAFEDDGNFQAAEVQKARFQEGVQAMRLDLLSTQQDRFHQIVDNFFE